MAGLIGFGLTSFTGSLRFESFGLRQVGGGVLALILGAGLLLQSLAAMAGTWDVGRPEERIPPAWAVVERFVERILPRPVAHRRPRRWAPAAGRRSERRLEAGEATIRYALTDRRSERARHGPTPSGPGPEHLERALGRSWGDHTHGGALSRRSGSASWWRSKGPPRGRARGARCAVGREPSARYRLHDLPERVGHPARSRPRDRACRPGDHGRRRPLHDRDVAARARGAARAGVRRVERTGSSGDRLPVRRI